MPDHAAFFSYVQADDDHDHGALTNLRRLLSAEMRMQTGSEFLIFQDREDILWGQRWQATINRSLDSTTLLIAIMTPSFFRSEACRNEVMRFLEREAALGRDDLIMPVYYVEASALDDPNDEIAVELGSRQYVDWRPLRFAASDDPGVRRKLAELAGQMVAAVDRGNPPPALSVVLPLDEVDDEPGFVELVAEAEDAMPLFNEVLQAFTTLMHSFTEIASASNDEIKRAETRPRPAQARLTIARKLAQKLEAPAAEMEQLSESYVEQLARVDGGISALADRVPELKEDAELAAAKELHRVLKELRMSADEGLGSVSTFSESLHSTARLSSTVRPVFRRIEVAVSRIVPTVETFARWERSLGEALAQRGDNVDGSPDTTSDHG